MIIRQCAKEEAAYTSSVTRPRLSVLVGETIPRTSTISWDAGKIAKTDQYKLKSLISPSFKPLRLLSIGIHHHETIKHHHTLQIIKLSKGDFNACTCWRNRLFKHVSQVSSQAKAFSSYHARKKTNIHKGLIPGLPEDMAKICLALVPRRHFPAMGAVSRRWMSFIGSREFSAVRKEVGKIEELVYVLAAEAGENGCRWEVLGERKNSAIPPMPGLTKVGFGVVVLYGKLYVIAGYAAVHGKDSVSDEVYQYDARLNRWGELAKMNVARRDFACAEVNGMIYAAGGFGSSGNSLSSVEAYDPQQNRWTLIDGLRRPRWGCFASGLSSKLYIMGGRSSFTIGNSRFVDVYDPGRDRWEEIKRGCVMVTSHAVVGESLFCVEWKNQRCLSAFDPSDSSWKKIPVPLTGSSSTRFCLGARGGKLLLLSQEEEGGYRTMTYDPAAAPGSEWGTSELKPSRLCLCSVTIQV